MDVEDGLCPAREFWLLQKFHLRWCIIIKPGSFQDRSPLRGAPGSNAKVVIGSLKDEVRSSTEDQIKTSEVVCPQNRWFRPKAKSTDRMSYKSLWNAKLPAGKPH